MKPDLVFRPGKPLATPKDKPCPRSATSAATPARASSATKPSKARSVMAAAPVTAKPIAANSAKASTSAAAKPAVSPKPSAKPKRKPRAPKAFNRDQYQASYMTTRREADAAGFGGSRDPNSTDFNPQYKTVSQYLEWKTGRG